MEENFSVQSQGRRQEYQALRSEILYCDRVCIIILGILLSASATVLGFSTRYDSHYFSIIISPLWIIGYFYISEKRFWIKRIALYLRDNVEGKDIGLGWERWLKCTKKDIGRLYLRYNPYILETMVTMLVVASVPVFIGSREGWSFRGLAFWVSSGLMVFTMIAVARNVIIYNRLGRSSDG